MSTPSVEHTMGAGGKMPQLHHLAREQFPTQPTAPGVDGDKPNVQYTVLVRLPFRRGSFQDPEQVRWDARKDTALWSLISSKGSNPKDLDWQKISERFEVNLSFLMMQAAWLYERHFEGVRNQMAMLGDNAGGGHEEGEQSKDTKPSSITTSRKAVPLSPGGVGSTSSTPKVGAPPLSRTASTNTVTQSRVFTHASKQSSSRPFRSSGSYQRRPRQAAQALSDSPPDEPESGHIEKSKQPTKNRNSNLLNSRVYTQPRAGEKTATLPQPMNPPNDGPPDNDEEEEDEDESSSNNFLPFASPTTTNSKAPKTATRTPTDPTATLRGSPKRQQKTPHPTTPAPADSSASSASSTQQGAPSTSDTDRRGPGPLSPAQRAKLARQMSPRYMREGDSEGTPSMGSSFSDLDDASVTRSALEDALLSNMQGNASLASRVSGIGNAFRSRYS